jgi:hypothetical protein
LALLRDVLKPVNLISCGKKLTGILNILKMFKHSKHFMDFGVVLETFLENHESRFINMLISSLWVTDLVA